MINHDEDEDEDEDEEMMIRVYIYMVRSQQIRLSILSATVSLERCVLVWQQLGQASKAMTNASHCLSPDLNKLDS